MTNSPSWFAARLLFGSVVAGEDSLFEETVVLVKSSKGIHDAEKRALALGKAAGMKYKNVEGATLTWTFRELLDLVELNEPEIGDGAEVYHHFLKPEEVESIRESLKSGSL